MFYLANNMEENMQIMMNVLELVKIIGLAIVGITAMCTVFAVLGGVIEKLEK